MKIDSFLWIFVPVMIWSLVEQYFHIGIVTVTWVSLDHKTENQIDHVTIGRKWRRSLQDVRNKRGADIGSDHHLVAKLKMKIQAYNRKTGRLRKW
jgi:hypothetical protein